MKWKSLPCCIETRGIVEEIRAGVAAISRRRLQFSSTFPVRKFTYLQAIAKENSFVTSHLKNMILQLSSNQIF